MYKNFEVMSFRNGNNPFYRVDEGFKRMEFDFDDFDDEDVEDSEDIEIENGFQKYEVWVDPLTFNVIIFERYDLTQEEVDNIDISNEISGAIRDSAYDYVINVLNTTTNTLVFCSQVEGTTSDYTIYYDMVGYPIFDYDQMIMMIEELQISNNEEFNSYKYVEVIGDKKFKITPEKMDGKFHLAQ